MDVPADSAGSRLDAFLGGALKEDGHSRAEIQAWLKDGRVHVQRNGQQVSPKRSLKVQEGDRVQVSIPPPPAPEGPPEPEPIPLEVLHEDAWVAVIAKPANLTVHPGAGQRDGTLVNALLHRYGAGLSQVGGEERPGIVHRLDKDTSGVIVVARTDAAHTELARQFHDREVSKVYWAIVQGARLPDEVEVDRPLGRHPKDRKVMAVVDGGRPARTRFRVLERWGRFAWVEARPETGRTHQIRVHLKSLGAPIVSDATYGKAWKGIARHALHAASLTLTHPGSNEHVTYRAAPPDDFAAALARLRG